MARRQNRFTVYDMLEAKGAFESNPANIDSRGPEGEMLYKGPIPYPKMMYHPLGERKMIAPGEIITTPMGPKIVGQQFEIVNRTVQTEAEERVLREAGWHDHPAKAMRAAGLEGPDLGPMDRMADLEEQIRVLLAEKAAAQAGPVDPLDMKLAEAGKK